jgi:hypothetical protein
MILGSLGLCFVLPLIALFFPLQDFLISGIYWILFALLFLFLIPLGIKSAWLRRRGFLSRLFHLDSLYGLSVLGAFLIHFVLASENPASWSQIFPLQLLLELSLFSSVWWALRILEAWWTEASLPLREDLSQPNQGIDRASLEKEELKLQSLIFGGAILGFLFCYWFASAWFTPYLSLALLIPVGIPTHQWWISRFWHLSREMGVRLQSLDVFPIIGRVKHFTTHQLGVFTDSKLIFQESWFDPSAGWSEEDLESLVYDLSHHSSHPICQSLQTHLLPRGNLHIDLSQVERINHLGLRVLSRGSSGEPLKIELGNLQAFILKTYDLSSEAKRRLADWQEAKRLCCFLAINQRIVAGFAFEQEARPSFEILETKLQSLKKVMCLMSSSAQTSIVLNQRPFAEIKASLLPLERELQWSHWKERFDEFVEFRGSWDLPEEGAKLSIEFVDKAHESSVRPSPVRIFKNHLKSAAWLLDNAQGWSQRKARLAYVGLGFLLIFAATSQTVILLPTIAGLYAFSFVFFPWRRSS